MTTEPFKRCIVETFKTSEVVAWTKGTETGRLFLPPIQRSVVWSNAQIVNYWDSLLRGYPAGLMMVHRSRQNKKGEISKGRTTDGQTCEATAADFHLFDGQQRITAILLGHQAGQLNNRVKLWVDLAMEPSDDSGLLFQLRVSSTGQPFGYQAQSPNQKPSLNNRREKTGEWVKANSLAVFDSLQAFAAVEGKDLIEAVCAVPLHQVISLLFGGELSQAIGELKRRCPDVPPGRIESFVQALDGALKLPIIFQLIDQKVVEKEKEYIRYFGRLGQGGTPLSNDELTYSILKHQYPEIHDRMEEIVYGPAGRVASEVNLVLAALRVAKILSNWNPPAEWEVIGRPYPGFVSRLKQLPDVAKEFQKMIPDTRGGLLKERLEAIRERVAYDKSTNPGGLPVTLLARLPHQLVDVLLLMATQWEQVESGAIVTNTLPSFVLHWLLFVCDDDKAATLFFRKWRRSGGIRDQRAIQVLIQDFEKDGIARVLPLKEQLPRIRADIEKGSHHLRPWAERFSGLDTDSERKSGDALRVLSSNNEIIKRTLMWLQREYLAENFGHFDPTSSRDEDLPIDLDHLIPHKKFGFNWTYRNSHIDFEDSEENFRSQRHSIGNSLGNHRWLDAAENRSRGAGEIQVLEIEGNLVQDPAAWNFLIRNSRWNLSDVAAFQRLIDLRTIDIYQELLVSGGLGAFIPNADSKLNIPQA